jgi:flavin reductase (DIM6/NTAB) family NADH-FMN oxidoreductase RutF
MKTSEGLTSQVSVADFTAVMGSFPAGVTVVTGLGNDGLPRGLTSTACCAVSLDPPMVLVCVDKTSTTLLALKEGAGFVVNYLREGAEDVARLFATKSDAKFADLTWSIGSSGAPVLGDHVCAVAEVRTRQVIEAGDHWVFIGDVIGAWADPDLQPLAYLRGQFRHLVAA